ncbi:ATP-dependent RNA helicase HrpA [Cellvibrio japonicus]|uniref:RNA helicase n=1 Tax=Cellvibrio japonicus (strain Ueda107) TaxID=498211 RepID=B3PK05_CELJU|nr:ATP-dependent RNA helicase HrpA [Cellvibrio japonicus]ACE83404.1 ATP-dependent helicase HrpA [Cellvibrio japonicus Ueda107]QEI12773.1 ATP-dependent RNA helicase HrpA [Cellvibrio japonicus]QEI16347.1 ATP-dependent RNA helicase HrpA [Cellvibrio japonicus]QEI19925.1 ATP-dependent RNA helicase HrpA [Cellvibrio japonicus]
MSEWSEYKQVLKLVMTCDRHRLSRRLQELEKTARAGKPYEQGLEKWLLLAAQSQSRAAARYAQVPAQIEFPPLPVCERREEIAALLDQHQVVVLAGETGSGKTTQLPKICLTIGRGVHGLIGHTQPRRIAANTVANRIAEELHSPLGDKVGYQVRFTDHSNDNTLIKVMTDGILLAEIQHDPFLTRYDTLIIDEAHERSLNIDFLLGYLKQLLPKRPDLKLIITSATIDLERFSRHFNNAPIIEVSGRTYPVEVWYRPLYEYSADEESEAEPDIYSALVDAVHEIEDHEKQAGGMRGGDILVFLSGEREIREAADALRKAQFSHLEVVPFYARLSLAEQQKVFAQHTGRRIVLATNVAETSITVPGIRYVIDPGFARISRYSYRTKVQRLPIEPISQASANQRKGRCGRVAEGICIRLYSEEDFNARPAFTDAEILRTNLAAVILQMLQLRMGDIHQFPFIDAPDHRLISDGFKLLEELQAVNAKNQLTAVGQQLSKLPLDPRLARMLLAAQQHACIRELLVIVSALSVQDPRERPVEKQQAADQMHRRFHAEHSDFLGYVSLWDYFEMQRQELSQNQLRKLCKKEFLSYLRLREWRDVHHQLCLAIKDLGFRMNTEPASYEAIHQALLTGLLGNLGFNHEEREYLGARNRKFTIFPGSSLHKKTPKWIMAAELIETSRLFAHTVAKIEPEWVIAAAQHLIKRQHFEPHYDSRSGQVMAYEKISLYGLTVVEKKAVSYSHIDPPQAREIFIRAALVEGQYAQHPKRRHQAKDDFFAHQQKLLADLDELESKARRRDILVDEQVIFDFYNERIPSHVVNWSGFESWRKKAEQQNPQLLYINRETLMRHGAGDITQAQFPNKLEWRGMEFPLSYHFEPGHPHDGVSIQVPVSLLHQVPEQRLEWLVPGMLRDKCIALVKGLPKQWRKHFVPVPDVVDKVLASVTPDNKPLTEVLALQLKRLTGIEIPREAWLDAPLDAFYQFNIHVLDERGKIMASGRELAPLREQYRERVQQNIQSAASNIERDAITQWDFGELSQSIQLPRAGVSIRAYPALVDKHTSVSLQVTDNPMQALDITQRGLARLLFLGSAAKVKYLQKELFKTQQVALTLAGIGNREQVIDDLVMAAIKHLVLSDQTAMPRTQAAFETCLQQVNEQLIPTAQSLAELLQSSLVLLVDLKKQLKQQKNMLLLAYTLSDIQQQLAELFYPGLVYKTPRDWFAQYPRYLQAILLRLEKAQLNPQKDKLTIQQITPYRQRWVDYLAKEGDYVINQQSSLMDYRWWVEELRVSLFAQTLKTRIPVSDKRLDKQWEQVLSQG